jgi:hypothetical protein
LPEILQTLEIIITVRSTRQRRHLFGLVERVVGLPPAMMEELVAPEEQASTATEEMAEPETQGPVPEVERLQQIAAPAAAEVAAAQQGRTVRPAAPAAAAS